MFGLFKKRKKKDVKKEQPVAVQKEETPVVVEEPEEVVQEEVTVAETPAVEEKEEVQEVEEKKEEPVKRKRKPINHITKHKDGGWQVKKEGAQRALKRFPTQKEAIEFAKNLEKTTETGFIIHKADGSTRKKTY